MIYLSISDKYPNFKWETALHNAIEHTCYELDINLSENDVSVVIEDNDALQKLNQDFRQINAPTDVLSFPADEIDPDTGRVYLGDIIISFPMAEKQAEETGHPLINELQLLSVHGMLHILGFDHMTSEDKEVMWKVQTKITDELKNKNIG